MADLSRNALIAVNVNDEKLIDATKKYSKLIKTEIANETLLEEINNGTVLSVEDYKKPAFFYTKDINSELKERQKTTAGKPSTIESPIIPKYDVEKTNIVEIYDFGLLLENFDNRLPANNSTKLAFEMKKFKDNVNLKLLRKLIDLSKSDAASYKLYKNKDLKVRENQPAQNANTLAGALAAIKAGKRIIKCSELDSKEVNRYYIVKAAIEFLNKLGKKTKSIENYYPFAKGFNRPMIKIATDLNGLTKLKAQLTSLLSDGKNVGIIADSILNVKLVETNMLPEKTEYMISTIRHWDHSRQFMGEMNYTQIERGGVWVDPEDQSTKKIPYSTAQLTNSRCVSYQVLYEGEVIYIERT